ncbi:MAG: hypothetical protein M3P84_06420, partial [Chloroflexota bacterium]|nr:hypothetical protein [Chloroflexota bacterium]
RRRPFLERNRGAVLALAAIAAVVLAGGFVVIQANSRAYACSTQTNPAPAAPGLAGRSAHGIGDISAARAAPASRGRAARRPLGFVAH